MKYQRIFGEDTFTWSAAGVGYPGEFSMAALSLMLGGNVRVGLEELSVPPVDQRFVATWCDVETR